MIKEHVKKKINYYKKIFFNFLLIKPTVGIDFISKTLYYEDRTIRL